MLSFSILTSLKDKERRAQQLTINQQEGEGERSRRSLWFTIWSQKLWRATEWANLHIKGQIFRAVFRNGPAFSPILGLWSSKIPMKSKLKVFHFLTEKQNWQKQFLEAPSGQRWVEIFPLWTQQKILFSVNSSLFFFPWHTKTLPRETGKGSHKLLILGIWNVEMHLEFNVAIS